MATLTQTAPDRFVLAGDLDLANVPALAVEGRRLGADTGTLVTIDLGEVGHGSSAAVALLLEWESQAERAGGRLRFVRWPDAMARIAALCNVDGLLQTDLAPVEARAHG